MTHFKCSIVIRGQKPPYWLAQIIKYLHHPRKFYWRALSQTTSFYALCSYIFLDGRSAAAVTIYWGCRPCGWQQLSIPLCLSLPLQRLEMLNRLRRLGIQCQPIRYKQKSTGDSRETSYFPHKGIAPSSSLNINVMTGIAEAILQPKGKCTKMKGKTPNSIA